MTEQRWAPAAHHAAQDEDKYAPRDQQGASAGRPCSHCGAAAAGGGAAPSGLGQLISKVGCRGALFLVAAKIIVVLVIAAAAGSHSKSGGCAGGAINTTSSSGTGSGSSSSSGSGSSSGVGASSGGGGGNSRSSNHLPRAMWLGEGRLGLRRADRDRAGSNSTSGGDLAGQGLCKLDYSIRNWEGRLVAACDMTKCEGRGKLEVPEAPEREKRRQRWTDEAEGAYRELGRNGSTEGWLEEPHVAIIKALTLKQHELGVFGSVGEISANPGMTLIALAGYSDRSERLLAFDLSEDGQGSNLDASGKGDLGAFLGTAERFGISKPEVIVQSGDSRGLSPGSFSEWGLSAFRAVSVGGGRGLEAVLNDLMVASCVMRDGGVIILDGFSHASWLGATEALVHWSYAQDRVVPLAYGHGKIWMTTASHYEEFRDLITSDPATFKCVQGMHASKTTVAGRQMCYLGPDKM